MSEGGGGLKWGVERRLEFIEFRLSWEGGVNRSDIIDMFGVSVPQASKDLTLYQERAHANAVYDKRAKRYVAGPDFTPIYLRPDPSAYLARLRSRAEGLTEPGESWIGSPPDTDIAITPRRRVEADVLRTVLAAIRDRGSLEVHYQSMSKYRADPAWRRMSPHALGYDGFRWHARAFCHVDGKFKDFLLPRILGVRSPGEHGATAADDLQWNKTFDVVIGPHPELTPSQKIVVAKDFSMVDGKAVLTVRYAMLFYVLKRLGLLGDATRLSARSQHIVNLNREETEAALKVADFQL
jgi:hypothetical protein